jgi:hypothetical protein
MASLELDAGSYAIQPCHILSYDSRKADGTLPRIRVGKYTSIAHNCTFVASQHRIDTMTTSPNVPGGLRLFGDRPGNPTSFSRGDIVIGSDVWIGANCTVLDGVTIGHGTVVAAGAVVAKDLPPYVVAAGVPARPIRPRFGPAEVAALLELRWWDLPPGTIPPEAFALTDVRQFVALLKKVGSNPQGGA